ncbi:hypothetical protein, partial [Mobiluncus mulieris]
YDGEGKILAQGDCGADSETLVITPDDSSSGGAGRDGGLAKTGVSPWVGRVSMLFLAAGLVLMVLSRRQHHHFVG